MKVYPVTSEEFKEYGQVLTGYDLSELLKCLNKTYISDSGITYTPSVDELEACNVKSEMQNRGFGGIPIQIGYVGGKSNTLNCLEYHKSSEFNVALNDVILILGNQCQIKNGKFDTSLCKAFLLPAGCGVEMYGTSLHYAPMSIKGNDFRVAVILPVGTNCEKPSFNAVSEEDKMCTAANKWLLAHEDSDEAKEGSHIGLIGKNLTFEDLEF